MIFFLGMARQFFWTARFPTDCIIHQLLETANTPAREFGGTLSAGAE
jgi:hypothetical protein